jgi:hypothetical protein
VSGGWLVMLACRVQHHPLTIGWTPPPHVHTLHTPPHLQAHPAACPCAPCPCSCSGHVIDMTENHDGSICVTILGDDNETVIAQTISVSHSGRKTHYVEEGIYGVNDNLPYPVCLTELDQNMICDDKQFIYRCTATKVRPVAPSMPCLL